MTRFGLFSPEEETSSDITWPLIEKKNDHAASNTTIFSVPFNALKTYLLKQNVKDERYCSSAKELVLGVCGLAESNRKWRSCVTDHSLGVCPSTGEIRCQNFFLPGFGWMVQLGLGSSPMPKIAKEDWCSFVGLERLV